MSEFSQLTDLPEFEKFQKMRYDYQAPRTVEEAKNRPDKSFYYIHGIYQPQHFLHPDVAFPDQVKNLIIRLNQESLNDPQREEEEDLFDSWTYSDNYHKYWSPLKPPFKFYTYDLCKDIVNFKNLETFECYELKLTTDLWIEFSKNCTRLKELDITCDCINTLEVEAIEHLLSIPTLEKVRLALNVTSFPPGPSNITELTIKHGSYEDEEYTFMDSWILNLRTHTNLKKLHLLHSDYTIKRVRPFVDLGLTCTELEEIEIERHNKYLDLRPLIKVLLTIPSLKKLKVDKKVILDLSV
jgi:hypothetical protein